MLRCIFRDRHGLALEGFRNIGDRDVIFEGIDEKVMIFAFPWTDIAVLKPKDIRAREDGALAPPESFGEIRGLQLSVVGLQKSDILFRPVWTAAETVLVRVSADQLEVLTAPSY